MTKGYVGSTTDLNHRDCWQTPVWLYNWLNSVYPFQMDVAASHENALCSKYYTEADNALEQPWSKMNFLNPPYSDIEPWCDAAIKRKADGANTVLVLPDDTGTNWFEKIYNESSRVAFIIGRVGFIHAATGKPVNNNNKATIIFAVGPDIPKSYPISVRRNDLMKKFDK